MTTSPASIDVCNLGTLNFSTVNSEKLAGSRHEWGENNSDDDMCQIDDKDDFAVGAEAKFNPVMCDDFNKVWNCFRTCSIFFISLYASKRFRD